MHVTSDLLSFNPVAVTVTIGLVELESISLEYFSVGKLKNYAVTRIRTWVIVTITQRTNHYKITA